MNAERESMFENELENMRKQLVSIRYESELQVDEYLKENHTLKNIENLVSKCQNFHSTSLEKEFKVVLNQLKTKETELRSIKGIKPKNHKVSLLNANIDELHSQQKVIYTELENIKNMMRNIENSSEKKDKESFEMIEMLTSQLYSYEQILVDSISQDNQKDTQKLLDRLSTAEQELEYAHKNLEQYITSVKSLEEIIENTTGDINSDMYKKAQIEIDRLNRENQSLLEIKISIDENHQKDKQK